MSNFLNSANKSNNRGGVVKGPEELIKDVLETDSITKVPVTKIKPHPLNPRLNFDEDELIELAESMVSEGQLRPLILKPDIDGNYILLAGERRWTANQKYNQWESMDAIIRSCRDEYEEITILFADNLHKELTYIDRAETAKTLIEKKGWDVMLVAQLPSMGDVQSVKDSMLFFGFPKNIRKVALQSERFGSSIAKVIHQILQHDKKATTKVINLLKHNAKLEEYETLLLNIKTVTGTKRINAVQPLFVAEGQSIGVTRKTHKGMKIELECSPDIIQRVKEIIAIFLESEKNDVLAWQRIAKPQRRNHGSRKA